jgi:ADP-ribosylglycohydrolase
LIGVAVGDALGAGYEFESAPFTGEAEMIGGGLGDFAPYEWTDDTAQTYIVAKAAAEHGDLRQPEALDAIAAGLDRWFQDDPPDVGNITRAVLTDAGPHPSSARLIGVARHYFLRLDRSGGNGALMRTAPVALAHLDDPGALVTAAFRVAELTHADPVAGESCAIWCLMIRENILLGGCDDPEAFVRYLPSSKAQTNWAQHLRDAVEYPASSFTPNGYTVTALQAAWAAIRQTPYPAWDPKTHFRNSLNTAIGVGNDTDTVAAIAGALLGARWGTAAIPKDWRERVHGWGDTPTGQATGVDLAALADRIVTRT